MRKLTFALGAATGAAIMYLLDPNNGETRRRDAQQRARELADSPQAQKLAGQAIEATRSVTETAPGSDRELVDKVRTEVLGRDEFSDLVINVDAHEGSVSLRGTVDDADRRDRLVNEVSNVTGVDAVASYLHASDQPAPNMTS